MEALEAVIQYLKGAGLSTSQIASKTHYGDADGWDVGSPAIVVRLDGGDPNLYAVMNRARIEVRTFAMGDYAAMALMDEVATAFRKAERVDQAVTGGSALIYWINPESGKSILFDPDIQMDFGLQFFEAAISVKGI